MYTYDLKPLDNETPPCINPFSTKDINRRDNIKMKFVEMIPHFTFRHGKFRKKPRLRGRAILEQIFNPLNPELNPICYLLALLRARHFLHVSRIRVKLLTFRRLMSYIYGAPILDVSRSHTTTQHSR